jgi:tRNA pseudouridine38-40 synthase
VVLSVDEAPEGFHARYDARRRRYHYYLATEPRVLDRHTRLFMRPAPDFERMNRAARHLLGKHDFDAFCRARSETTNRICTVYEASWHREARPGDWTFAIEADRFLHGMVRSIVGTLLQVGHNRRDGEQLPDVLASRDRRRAGPAAPAHGLVLEEVSYRE